MNRKGLHWNGIAMTIRRIRRKRRTQYCGVPAWFKVTP